MEINVTNHIALLFAGIVTPQDMIFFKGFSFRLAKAYGEGLYMVLCCKMIKYREIESQKRNLEKRL